VRDKIKNAAVDLITRRGYHAVTFREIAAVVQTTRANMHYHFGSKDHLIEEVLEDYVDEGIETYRRIFTEPNLRLDQKVAEVVKYLRERFDSFNLEAGTAGPWSLTARLRSDWEALSPAMQATMRRFSGEIETLIGIGVALAVSSGELRPETPQDAVCVQLMTGIIYAANMTRDTQSFDQFPRLMNAMLETIYGAYAAPGATREPLPTRARRSAALGARRRTV